MSQSQEGASDEGVEVTCDVSIINMGEVTWCFLRVDQNDKLRSLTSWGRFEHTSGLSVPEGCSGKAADDVL